MGTNRPYLSIAHFERRAGNSLRHLEYLRHPKLPLTAHTLSVVYLEMKLIKFSKYDEFTGILRSTKKMKIKQFILTIRIDSLF